MRLAIGAAIIALTVSVAAGAQDAGQQLADVARQVRQDRAARGVVAGVVTNESIRRVRPPVVIGRVGEIVPGAPVEDGAADATPDVVAVASDDPDEALAQARRRVQGLEDQEVRLQLEINRQRARFQAPVISQREREEALDSMTDSETSLENLRAELAEAMEALAVLEAAVAPEARLSP